MLGIPLETLFGRDLSLHGLQLPLRFPELLHGLEDLGKVASVHEELVAAELLCLVQGDPLRGARLAVSWGGSI